MNALRNAFRKHPILGNVAIYSALYVGAEFMQQTAMKKVLIEEGAKPQPYDTGVLVRYGILGSCVFPHTLYHAYKYLDNKFVGSSMKMVLRKLACDALIVTPINLSIFYIALSVMESKEDIFKEWREKIIPTFLVGSLFWVPGNLINFKFLPAQYRVVYVGACQIIWVSILCWFKRQDYSKEKE